MKRKPETTTAKANAKKQRDNNQNLIENIIKTKPTKNAKLKQKELESEGIDFGSDMFRSRIMSPPVRMYNTGLAYDQDINNSKFEPDLFSDDGGQQQRFSHKRTFQRHTNMETVPNKKTEEYQLGLRSGKK